MRELLPHFYSFISMWAPVSFNVEYFYDSIPRVLCLFLFSYLKKYSKCRIKSMVSQSFSHTFNYVFCSVLASLQMFIHLECIFVDISYLSGFNQRQAFFFFSFCCSLSLQVTLPLNLEIICFHFDLMGLFFILDVLENLWATKC